MSFEPSMNQQYLLTEYSTQPTQNSEYPGTTTAAIIMSVMARDAINRFIGCCRSRGLVAMDRSTVTLPSRVTAPKEVLRAMNVVSIAWSQDEWAVMFVSRSDLFTDISFWPSCDLVAICTCPWRRQSLVWRQNFPEICVRAIGSHDNRTILFRPTD